MNTVRYDEVKHELGEYDPYSKLGWSTVTVGELLGLIDKVIESCNTLALLREEQGEAADTIERLQKDMDAGRELMRQAWHVFNGIRAADGAPYGYSHEWWDEITETLSNQLSDDTVPWMLGSAKALTDPLMKEIQIEQDARMKAEQERDAALAEVERLKGLARDRLFAQEQVARERTS